MCKEDTNAMRKTRYTYRNRSTGSETLGPQPAPSSAVGVNLEGRTVSETKETQL